MKIFILCFSVENVDSFKNIIKIWCPELRREMPNTPIVLCATDIDKRETLQNDTIEKHQSEQLSKNIRAKTYIEYSNSTTEDFLKHSFSQIIVLHSIEAIPKYTLEQCQLLKT